MNRRRFIKHAAALSASARLAYRANAAPISPPPQFKVGAISDGFSQDFEEAAGIIKSFGLQWVEIRRVYGIYNTEATSAQIRQMNEIVKRNGLRVSVIDSALYKCTLPGTTPITNEKDSYPYSGQDELLKRACDRANVLGAGKVRIFTFWRVSEPDSISQRIAAELQKAADLATSHGVRLVIENEESCNAATGHELGRILAAVPVSNLGANWDVGNGYTRGEVSYPNGYEQLEKARIWHMHLKSMKCREALRQCSETIAGEGQVDLVGQFKALLRDRYHETMSVECEFSLPGLSHSDTAKRSVEGVLRAMTRAVADRNS